MLETEITDEIMVRLPCDGVVMAVYQRRNMTDDQWQSVLAKYPDAMPARKNT